MTLLFLLGEGGYLKMEHQLGSILSQAYCGDHRDRRVDPWELMRRVREPLEGKGSEVLNMIGAIEVSNKPRDLLMEISLMSDGGFVSCGLVPRSR